MGKPAQANGVLNAYWRQYYDIVKMSCYTAIQCEADR